MFAARTGVPAVLVHADDYQREKAESLAAMAPGVRAVALADGAEAVATAAAAAIGTRPAPLVPDGPLPAVAWLGRRLRGGRLRRLLAAG